MKAADDSLRHYGGDVLFSKLRPYLAKSYAPAVAGTGTGELLVLRPGGEIDSRFLLYVTLSSPWLDWASATSYGSKMPRTSWELMSQYRVWLPPLEEQRRIADFLDAETSRVDRMISLSTRTLGLLAERRDIERSQILRGEGLGGSTATHPVLGDVLASWPILPLKRLLPRIGVGVVVDPSKYFCDVGVPFLRGSNVVGGGFDLTDVRKISEENSRELWRSRLAEGDVVVVRAGDPGRAAVVTAELDGANCASILVLKRGQRIRPKYLESYFNSSLGRAYVDMVRYGAAQEQINVSHVVNFMMPEPSLAEQDIILGQLAEADGPTESLERSLRRMILLLAERRQSLITAAVTGQLDVTTASGRNLTQGV
ncbi:Type I restriction enzyme EcoKI specificity protein [Nocardia asteroides]|nr:type I restriction enzyme, S subunit [Nocardia asteroides]VEG34351.1 Type I restriction enzyme EcoKI specificity protein [Nocardia asteroides]